MYDRMQKPLLVIVVVAVMHPTEASMQGAGEREGVDVIL